MASITDYLTDGEEVRLRWQGGLKSDDDGSQSLEDRLNSATNGEASFAATDRRLLILDGDGGFKDIDNAHISSVEAESSTEPDPTATQSMAMLGGGLVVAGLFALFGMGEAGTGIAGMVVGGLLFGAAWTDVDDPAELFDLEEVTTYEVRIITGDEAHQHIEFETEENVGAELSRIVRNHGS